MCSIEHELPRYKSHKEVWALQIESIKRDGEGENRDSDGSAMITPKEEGYAPFKVSADYMHKHKPEVGGYYVVYKDGYESFSPAKAFEEGNTLIEKITGIDEFITERTRIISEMLDNPDENGIYPTTKCFGQLDKLFDKIVGKH